MGLSYSNVPSFISDSVPEHRDRSTLVLGGTQHTALGGDIEAVVLKSFSFPRAFVGRHRAACMRPFGRGSIEST